uniref:TTF-type domain-containing protein n=1 Tax=Fagus sylvatica TaxID=28930 RepID=A0A2N9F8G4_FAGSY
MDNRSVPVEADSAPVEADRLIPRLVCESHASRLDPSSSLNASRLDRSSTPHTWSPGPELDASRGLDPSRGGELARTGPTATDLPSDPGLRPRITDYHPNDRDQVRRAYAQRKARQPKEHNFPYKTYGAKDRRFNKGWFTQFDWLEYSIAKDAAFCLYCYLFKRDVGEQAGGDTFVTEGFSNWKCPEKLRTHVGGINSSHNQARRMFEDLLKPNQSIQSFHFKQTDQARIEYRTRLNASIDCIRFLLRQGLAFRGHDESEDSSNQGNFLKLLKFLADHNEDIKAVTLRNAPENNMMISPAIQKDIEQMAVALRYVDKKGHVVERFLGIEHVTDTTALSLKAAVEDLFCRHGLSLSRLRGQGYDGASNMQGQFNGLKTLIMKENESAYYVHCFAHQLQLALVAVAKNNNKIATFFNFVANVVNIAGGSCKRLDLLKEKQAIRVVESVHNGELPSGQGLNQETSLKRSCDTRWSSHYNTMISLIDMFPSIVDVLDAVAEDGATSELRGQAEHLSHFIQSFGFVFNLHLMRYILGVSNELSQALQRKDQDIVNAMNIEFSKLEGICDLAQKMVETKKNVVYPLVYLLVTLALTLPVATATVERAFSAMKIVKNRLRSRMSDQWMNDSLIVYIEKDIFHSIDNEAIMQRFQNMKTRRNQL